MDLSEKAIFSMGIMLAVYSGCCNLDGMHCAEQNSFETVRKGLKTADGRSLAEVTQARMEELKAVGRKKYKFHEYRKSLLQPGDAIGYGIMSQILGIAAKENNNLTLGEAYFDKLPSGRSVAHDVIAWDNEIKPWKDYRSADKVGEKLLGNDNKTDAYSKYMDPIHSMFTLMDRPDYIEKNL